jgi:hypothetical protein
MRIHEHLERAEAFERSVAKLDPIRDTELFVVFLMRAATSRMNAALHALGVTEEGPVAAGVRVADLNHSYKPPLDVEVSADVRKLLGLLKTIEDLRPQYVRGPDLLTPELAAACKRAHEEIVSGTSRLLESNSERV